MILPEPEEGGHNSITSSDAGDLDTEKEDDDTPRGNKRDNYIPTQSEESHEEGEEKLFTSPIRKIIKGSTGTRMQNRVNSVEQKKGRKTKDKQVMRDRVQAMRTQRMTPGELPVRHMFSIAASDNNDYQTCTRFSHPTATPSKCLSHFSLVPVNLSTHLPQSSP